MISWWLQGKWRLKGGETAGMAWEEEWAHFLPPLWNSRFHWESVFPRLCVSAQPGRKVQPPTPGHGFPDFLHWDLGFAESSLVGLRFHSWAEWKSVEADFSNESGRRQVLQFDFLAAWHDTFYHLGESSWHWNRLRKTLLLHVLHNHAWIPSYSFLRLQHDD